MKLPLMSARELMSALSKLGFKPIRQKGSHIFLQHPDGRTTVVPNHPGEKLDRSLTVKIIKKDVGITVKEFLELLD